MQLLKAPQQTFAGRYYQFEGITVEPLGHREDHRLRGLERPGPLDRTWHAQRGRLGLVQRVEDPSEHRMLALVGVPGCAGQGDAQHQVAIGHAVTEQPRVACQAAAEQRQPGIRRPERPKCEPRQPPLSAIAAIGHPASVTLPKPCSNVTLRGLSRPPSQRLSHRSPRRPKAALTRLLKRRAPRLVISQAESLLGTLHVNPGAGAEVCHLGHATKATAIADWEVGLPRLNALHPVSCPDHHANHRRLMQRIERALIGR